MCSSFHFSSGPVCICYLMLLLTFLKAVIVICLNTFCFPEQFCSFTCYVNGMFQSKCPFTYNKVSNLKTNVIKSGKSVQECCHSVTRGL